MSSAMGFGSNAAGLFALVEEFANPSRTDRKALGNILARLPAFVARLYHPFAQILRIRFHASSIGNGTSNLELL